MQNTNKIKPAFPLSLLTCALALATGVASAQTIEVTNGETYTQNVVATDATTSLTIQGGTTPCRKTAVLCLRVAPSR